MRKPKEKNFVRDHFAHAVHCLASVAGEQTQAACCGNGQNLRSHQIPKVTICDEIPKLVSKRLWEEKRKGALPFCFSPLRPLERYDNTLLLTDLRNYAKESDYYRLWAFLSLAACVIFRIPYYIIYHINMCSWYILCVLARRRPWSLSWFHHRRLGTARLRNQEGVSQRGTLALNCRS